jgi:hypothetical protein
MSIEKSMMENVKIKYSAQRNLIGAGCAIVGIIRYLTEFRPDKDILPECLYD